LIAQTDAARYDAGVWKRSIVCCAVLISVECGSKSERGEAPSPSAPAPGPVVHIHSLAVAGNLSQSEGRAVIEHNLPDWRACYVAALEAEPELCGHLSVDIEHHRHGGFGHSYPRERRRLRAFEPRSCSRRPPTASGVAARVRRKRRRCLRSNASA
jgi:hypothetical protein